MTGSYSRNPRHFILVGGLTDDFFPTTYVQLLTERLNDMEWSIVQPLLASSGTGYGTSSLDQDAYQLDQLAQHLRSFYNSQGIVMMGHSTGCQDTVRYVQRNYSMDPSAPPLMGVILQAPVSDRQFREAYNNDNADDLQRADGMIAGGQGDAILKREKPLGNAPITANRFHAIAARGGDDDMFSSDLSDADLKRILGPLAALPTGFVLSGNDSTVPPFVDIPALARRFVAAVGPSAQSIVVPGADHSLQGFEREAVDSVMALMARVNRTALASA
ncbi:hypothetical protein WJX81_000330 [Elliptochloris bilobata]|uniref:Uncharacterized protein n=1 Tax=Elliptochloris bilobata TaxID=381761 RepID=A0AAW1RDX8_9CHLO